MKRLLDPGRDPGEKVQGDDWHPVPRSPLAELDRFDTVERRRRWRRALLEQPWSP